MHIERKKGRKEKGERNNKEKTRGGLHHMLHKRIQQK
jgi:hypothetical protein